MEIWGIVPENLCNFFALHFSKLYFLVCPSLATCGQIHLPLFFESPSGILLAPATFLCRAA